MTAKTRQIQLKIFLNDDDSPVFWLNWTGLTVDEFIQVCQAVESILVREGKRYD